MARSGPVGITDEFDEKSTDSIAGVVSSYPAELLTSTTNVTSWVISVTLELQLRVC